MKCLILLSLFTANFAFAEDEIPATSVLSERELGTKFVSVIQASRIEDTLIQSGEFRECAESARFNPGTGRDAQVMDKATADAVQRCFQTKLEGKSADDLKKLSDTLNLKGFQLIRSQNVQEVTNFLTNRVYKKMTGIDLDERNVENRIRSLKFSNPDRKLVDQRDFVELYRIELGKSALYEISRFCFNNLRVVPTPGTPTGTQDFVSHWAGNIAVPNPTTPGKYTDTGVPSFGSVAGTSNQEIYANIQKTFSSSDLTPASIQGFFVGCMATITPLCKQFQDTITSDGNRVATNPTSTSPTPLAAGTLTPGSNACLTQSRLQEIRKAMKNTTVVLADFDTLRNTGKVVKLDQNAEVKTYDAQNAQDGFNSISTLTSRDFLQGQGPDQERLAACSGPTPDPEECAGFQIKDDSYKKAIHDTDFNLTLKAEIELKRIEALRDGGNLDKYLTDNGYFELQTYLNSTPRPTDAEFSAKVKKFFDAQRVAAIEGIKNKVGNRQADSDSTEQDVTNSIKANVDVSKEERGRLAQVVLFTNIVTSELRLERRTGQKTESLGRNTLGLQKERESLNEVDSNLFSGLQNTSGSSGNSEDANQSSNFLEDIDFLDTVLGKPATP